MKLLETLSLYARFVVTGSEDIYEKILGEKKMGVKSTNEATITKKKGRFVLRSEDGTIERDYARRRDAKRGAERFGLVVV